MQNLNTLNTAFRPSQAGLFISKKVSNESQNIGLEINYSSDKNSDQKVPEQVLDLVDQIKAQVSEKEHTPNQPIHEVNLNSTGPRFFTSRPNQSHFDLLKEFLAKKRQSPKYVIEDKQRLTLLTEGFGNATQASKVSPSNPSTENYEDKCLQMILSPKFVDNLGISQQPSGSTIPGSSQSEKGNNDHKLSADIQNHEGPKAFSTVQKDKIEQTFPDSPKETKAPPSTIHDSTRINTHFKLPDYDNKVDYEYQYMYLFQNNEKKLYHYDSLLNERDKLLNLYNAAKTGDFSQLMNHTKVEQPAHNIYNSLLPQLIGERQPQRVSKFDDDDLVTALEPSINKRRRFDKYQMMHNNDSLSENYNQLDSLMQRDLPKSINRENGQEEYSKMSMSQRNYAVSHRQEGQDANEEYQYSMSETQQNDDSYGSNIKGFNGLMNSHEMRMQIKREQQRKKHVRRCAKELKKEFPCLYNCGKEYATDAARNMHMREKHNEVTKTERDRKARDIIKKCGLKNNSEIVSKLSLLTKQQQKQLQNELMVQTNKENEKMSVNKQQ